MLFLKKTVGHADYIFLKISLPEQSFLKVKATEIEISSNTQITTRGIWAVFVTPHRLSAAFFLAGSSHTFTQLSHLPWIFTNLFLRCFFPAFRSAHRFSKGKEERSSLGTPCVTAFKMIRHDHKGGCKELYGRFLPNWKSKLCRDTDCPKIRPYVWGHCPDAFWTSEAHHHDHSLGEPVLVPDLVKNVFLIPNLNLSCHSSMLFPQVLLLVTRERRSAPAPSLPIMR